MNDLQICPSILAADFANLQSEIAQINGSQADYVHIDIMDGMFVPNISFGFPVTQAMARHSQKPLDFHLMIEQPDRYLQHCKNSGAQIISVHYEACTHLHRTIGAIQELNIKPGVAINPHTPVEVLTDILPELHLVVIMSVNPGFGGQKFITNTYDKIRRLRELTASSNPNLRIEIDGGVTMENAPELRAQGADMLVAGSFVFSSTDPAATIKSLKSIG